MFASCAGAMKEILKMRTEELSIEDTSDMQKRLYVFITIDFKRKSSFQLKSLKYS
jgi:hypothetical protein